MRTIEMVSLDGRVWTLEVAEELEKRIAISLDLDPYEQLSDDEIKDFFVNSLMKEKQMLSMEIVKE